MKCPVCKDVTLLMSEKKGVEIDYCPECRGIWLDRGELEKLIQGEEKYVSSREHEYHKHFSHYDHDDDHDHYKSHHDYDKDYYHHKKRKESFLGDLFDF